MNDETGKRQPHESRQPLALKVPVVNGYHNQCKLREDREKLS